MTTVTPTQPNTKYLSPAQWAEENEQTVLLFSPDLESWAASHFAAIRKQNHPLACEVELICGNRPYLAGRVIEAAHLVMAGAVDVLHPHHYHVKEPAVKYPFVVAFFEYTGSFCTCMDWYNGNAAHEYQWASRKTYAPHVAGLGVVCKHVAATILHEALTPTRRCENCNGSGLQEEPPILRVPSYRVVPCRVCRGSGIESQKPLGGRSSTPAPGEFDEPGELGPDDLTDYLAAYYDLIR